MTLLVCLLVYPCPYRRFVGVLALVVPSFVVVVAVVGLLLLEVVSTVDLELTVDLALIVVVSIVDLVLTVDLEWMVLWVLSVPVGAQVQETLRSVGKKGTPAQKKNDAAGFFVYFLG